MTRPLPLLLAFAACANDVGPIEPSALDQGFEAFVVAPNAEVAGQPDLLDPERWDARLADYTYRSVDLHLTSWAFFARLDQVRDDYAYVVSELRAAGLPEVLAGVPYAETRYDASVTSPFCAAGPWQFMAWVTEANTAQDPSLDVHVRGCELDGSEPWDAPTRAASSSADLAEVARTGEGFRCRITSCDRDDRRDLQASTRLAVHTFSLPWNDPDVRASGSAAQLTLLSHNVGYDDKKVHGTGSKRFQVGPALRDAVERDKPTHTLVGDAIRTATPGDPSWGGSPFPPEAQHYAYTAIAQHLLAACYYGQNYASETAFAPYARFSEPDGYCAAYRIPTPTEVQLARKS